MIYRHLLSCLFCFVFSVSLKAQDPFYTHFYGNESSFNPAYVGKRGALSITAKYRSQWGSSNARPYRTAQVLVEESLPCFFLDWGIHASRDEEGEGLLTTNELGLKTAIHIYSWEIGRQGLFNLRAGFGAQVGQRRIDYSRIDFLDQLDPLYGLSNPDGTDNPTTFSPSDSDSPWYFSSSLGFMGRVISDVRSKKAWVAEFSGAVHNWSGLSGIDAQQSASLLGLSNPLGERFVLSAAMEFPVVARRKTFVALRPSIMSQWQEGLSYAELGLAMTWQRNLTMGIYYHGARFSANAVNTNWMSFQFSLGMIMRKDAGSTPTRLDLGINLNVNQGGIGSALSAPIELTATLSFGGRSPSCSLAGAGDQGSYEQRATSCYLFDVGSGRKKVYDNIWYSNIQL